MRLVAFILALVLLAGAVDATRGVLIALVVVSGIAALRPRIWNPLHMRPALDLRLGVFVIAVLLLAGAVDPTRNWLIALSVVGGLAAFMPRVLSFDAFDRDRRAWSLFGDSYSRRERARWHGARAWDRWERRMDRRSHWGDDRS